MVIYSNTGFSILLRNVLCSLRRYSLLQRSLVLAHDPVLCTALDPAQGSTDLLESTFTKTFVPCFALPAPNGSDAKSGRTSRSNTMLMRERKGVYTPTGAAYWGTDMYRSVEHSCPLSAACTLRLCPIT